MSRDCTATGCAGPIADSSSDVVCRRCSDYVQTQLAELIDGRLADLETSFALMVSLNDRNGSRSSDIPLPYDVAAGDLLHRLTTLVIDWCWRTGAFDWGQFSIRHSLVWLSDNLDRITTNDRAGDFVYELGSLTRSIRQCVDLPQDRGQFPVGHCVDILIDGSPCPGQLWVKLGRTVEDRSLMKCNACGVEYGPESWLKLGRRMLDRAPC